MSDILVFIWIFIIPISLFAWGIFHNDPKENYKLNEIEVKDIRSFFGRTSVPMMLFSFLGLLAINNFDFSKFMNESCKIFIFFEIIFLDFISFLFMSDKTKPFLSKKGFGLLLSLKNWEWFKVYFSFFINPIYFLITIFFISELSLLACRILIVVYPFCVYLKTKDLYAIFLSCQRIDCQQRRKFNALLKKGKSS